ncbi:hypothetical protein FQA39_LY03826 [Lamprigera yunnana]|nr:hypothetical protein FQA39_LY03826 [Lamprigera yunnana]
MPTYIDVNNAKHLKMKFFIFFGLQLVLISFTLIYSVEIPTDSFHEKSAECLKELNIDPKSLPGLFHENFHFKARTKVVEDFIECAVEKRKLIKDGKLDSAQMEWDVEHVLFPMLGKGDIPDKNSKAKEVVKNCVDVTGHDLVDRIMKFHNCLADEGHKV